MRLQHMLDAANEALGFIQGKTRPDLDKDRMLVLSLVKELEIIGEAASKVSPEVRSQNNAIPWQDIGGMRNRFKCFTYDDLLKRDKVNLSFIKRIFAIPLKLR